MSWGVAEYNLHSFEEACENARHILESARKAREDIGFQPHLVNFVTIEGALTATLMPPPPITRDALLIIGSELAAQYAVVVVEGIAANVGGAEKAGAVMAAVEAGATAEEALAGCAEMRVSLMAILEHPMGVRVWVCEPEGDGEILELHEHHLPAGSESNPLHNITGCGPDGAIAEAWAAAMERFAD